MKHAKLLASVYGLVALIILFASHPSITGSTSHEMQSRIIKDNVLDFFKADGINFVNPNENKECAGATKEIFDELLAYEPKKTQTIGSSDEQRIQELIFGADTTFGKVNMLLGGDLAAMPNPKYFRINAKLEKMVFGFTDMKYTLEATLNLEGLLKDNILYVQKGSLKSDVLNCEFG